MMLLSSLPTLLLGLSVSFAAAQESIVNPTTAAASATAVPTAAHGYTYAGCWNETVGIASSGGTRALMQGNSTANNEMTIDACMDFCGGGLMQYAGLEYGRECYCGKYFSTLSEKLNESICQFACDGNATEICGGSLAITLYNLTEQSKTSIAWSLVSGSATWYGTAAFVSLMIAALL